MTVEGDGAGTVTGLTEFVLPGHPVFGISVVGIAVAAAVVVVVVVVVVEAEKRVVYVTKASHS